MIVDRYVPIADDGPSGYVAGIEHYIGESRIFEIPDQLREKFRRGEAKILDIGTGKGGVVEELRKRGYKNAVGVDYSSIIGKGTSSEGKVRGDVRRLPFPDEVIDIIISMGIVDEYLYKQGEEDYQKMIGEILRVLVKDGVYFTTGADFMWSDKFRDTIIELEKKGKLRIKWDEEKERIRNIIKI